MSSPTDHPVSLPSFAEPVPSTGSPTSDPRSQPSDSSSGTALHGPDKDRKVENITGIFCKEQGEVRAQDENGHRMTVDMLPDNVLLEIFDSYRCLNLAYNLAYNIPNPVWRWYGLVHVCQRWRQIVFGSPQRLDLLILCTDATPVRERLDCWPPFPIAIQFFDYITPDNKDSLFAALEHRSRIRQIDLTLEGPQFEQVTTVMQEPFPALTHITLRWEDEGPSALPSGFLGGTAPCLQYMYLDGIPFPAVPALLLSASDLVSLSLSNMPVDGYISPEAMVAGLAALPKLKHLCIEFISDKLRPDRIGPPPLTRILLPALTSFVFQGNSEYLEELISGVDSPQLQRIIVRYLSPLFQAGFQVAQLFKFMDRSENPMITLIRNAEVIFSPSSVIFEISPCPESHPDGDHIISLTLVLNGFERQVSRVAQVLSQPSAMLCRVIHLKLSRYWPDPDPHDNQWLPHLLRQFPTVRTLHVSLGFERNIALALEDVAVETVAEVLPVLDLIYLEDQPATSIEKFLAARRLSGHPVTHVDTEAEFDERIKSYVSG